MSKKILSPRGVTSVSSMGGLLGEPISPNRWCRHNSEEGKGNTAISYPIHSSTLQEPHRLDAHQPDATARLAGGGRHLQYDKQCGAAAVVQQRKVVQE